jgi:hypothetical protein
MDNYIPQFKKTAEKRLWRNAQDYYSSGRRQENPSGTGIPAPGHLRGMVRAGKFSGVNQ